jgi:hypothetical protein
MADDPKKSPRWTHIRVPVAIAQRINALVEATERAYAEGRVELPSSMADRVPAWFVIDNALNEQEARRERSRRPRRKTPAES